MYARRGFSSLVALACAALLLGGCGNDENAGDDQRTGSVTSDEMRSTRADWPEGAAAQLDSGNAAFSAQQYPEALRHYQAILDMENAPRNLQLTAHFGQYMTYSAQGDTVRSKEAAARMQALEPNASLLDHGNPMMGSQAAPPAAPNDSIHQRRNQ